MASIFAYSVDVSYRVLQDRHGSADTVGYGTNELIAVSDNVVHYFSHHANSSDWVELQVRTGANEMTTVKLSTVETSQGTRPPRNLVRMNTSLYIQNSAGGESANPEASRRTE